MPKQKPGAIAKKLDGKFKNAADDIWLLGNIIKLVGEFVENAANYEFLLQMKKQGWVELVEGDDLRFSHQSGYESRGFEVYAKEHLLKFFSPREIEILDSILAVCMELDLFDRGNKRSLFMRTVLCYYKDERNHALKRIIREVNPKIRQFSGTGQKLLKDMIDKITAPPAE